MEAAYEIISKYFDLIVEYLVLIIEFIGIAIIIYEIFAAVVGLFKKYPHVRLKLAEGLALALEFKIGSELLRTVIVREWEELLMLGAVIVLRALLTFLIQWEIKTERKSGYLTDNQINEIKSPLMQSEPHREKKRNKKGETRTEQNDT